MALARSLVSTFQGAGTLDDFMSGPGARLRILEVNEAGTLTPFLSRAPGHRLVRFPEVDLHALPFPDGTFDLVVHSDTLEHVERPVRALEECKRVLVAGGFCAFTIPVVIGRLTLSREGMPLSFHGNAAVTDPALAVRTEYGADAWGQVVAAGFAECRIVAYEGPSTMAFVARRGVDDQPPTRPPARGSVSEETVLQMKWFYRFRLPSGARTESVLPPEVFPIHETRERMLLDLLDPIFGDRWKKTDCLDIACHEGYFGSLFAQRGCRVLGIDARPENLTRAELMRDALRLENLEFRQADVSSLDPASLGRFDIVLMLGLLYHLEDPIGALHRTRAMCREVAVIETQLGPELGGSIEWGTAKAQKEVIASFVVVDETDEVRSRNREANTRPLSLVPDLQGLLRILKSVGFSRVQVLRPPEDGYEQFVRGRRAMVAAWA